MQYKCTRKGHPKYRLKRKYVRKLKKMRNNTLIVGGIILSIYTINSKININKNFDTLSITEENNSDIDEMPVAGISTLKFNNDDIGNENMKIKEIFSKYCKIYNINMSMAYNKASELTNNFTSFDFIYDNSINGTQVCGNEQIFDSKEEGIICFIRHLKQIPTDFNLTKNDIYLNQNFETNEIYECQVENLCEIFQKIPKELCLAIVYSENARDLTGSQFLYNNNPGCLRNSEGGMQNFENNTQGTIELIINLKYKFLENIDLEHCNMNEVIDLLQPIYAPIDDPENKNLKINENWSKNVKSIYSKLCEDYYSIYNKKEGLSR